MLKDKMQINERYFKIKFMIEYILITSKLPFPLLPFRININLQSRWDVGNSTKNKPTRCSHVQSLKKQGHIVPINFAAINRLVTQYY